MDKRNRPALAYLLVGVASAGRAMLAMPDAVALQEVSLTVLALVGYLLLGRRALPVLACGTVQLVLELVLCGTLAGPAWLAPLLRVAALWLLWATVTQMLKIAGYTTGKNAKMPIVAADGDRAAQLDQRHHRDEKYSQIFSQHNKPRCSVAFYKR